MTYHLPALPHLFAAGVSLLLWSPSLMAAEPEAATFTVGGGASRLDGGNPSVVLAGADGKAIQLSPNGAPAIRRDGRSTVAGNAVATTFTWTDPLGHALGWTVSRLEQRQGLTLQMSFTNHGSAAVRLREFQLAGQATFAVEGAPQAWFLSTLDSHDSSVGGYNPSKDLGQAGTLNFLDTLTLYTDLGATGMFLGAVGPAVSDIRFRCQLAGNSPGLVIASEMNDVVVDPGETRISEEVLILAEPFKTAAPLLFQWLAKTHGSRTAKGAPTGWCSWYDKGAKIDEAWIEKACAAVEGQRDRLPLQVIQIDDGWQKAYGDWTADPVKFPRGMQPIAERIRAAGAIPGIWLCPNRTSKEGAHPDGTANEWQDGSNPAVQEFIRTALRARLAEGFRYFKLDFLWVRNLATRHDQKKTRLEICRDINRLYRESIGEDAYLLSCVGGFNRGCFGFADGARTGTDTTRKLGELYKGCSLANSLNALGSTALANGVLFANDPDVPYLDLEGNPLLRTWFTGVGLLGGLMLTSERLHELPPTALRNHELLLPPAPDRGMAFDGQTDPWHRRFGFVARKPWGAFASVMLWNPASEPRDLDLAGVPLESLGTSFHVWSFWDERYLGVADAGFAAKAVASLDHRLLRLTPVQGDGPALIGSTLHISMGSAEIDRINVAPDRMLIELTDAGAREGALYVHSPRPLCLDVTANCTVVLTNPAEGLWKIAISGRQRGKKQSIALVNLRNPEDATIPKQLK